MNLIVPILIIFGGLRFMVLLDVAQIFRGERHRLQAHSKLVLVVSGFLIVGGTLSLLVLEWSTPKTLG